MIFMRKASLGQKSSVNEFRSALLMPVIILAVSLGVYFNTLYNGFVYDDMLQVLQNPWIRDIKFLPDIFSKNVWGFQRAVSNYYRPLMHTIYMIDYHIFGLRPWGFHLVNVLFHAANSILVFFITSKLFKKSSPLPDYSGSTFAAPPFIAALLFAVHPIHTEAVAWIGAVTDVSYAFFFLLSFYGYITSDTDIRKRNYILSVVSFSLALLCKEPAATLPVILAAYDFAFSRKGERFSERAKRYIPYFIVLGGYFIVRINTLGGFAPSKAHTELSTYQYVINVLPLFAQYIGKLLLPVNLNAFITLSPIASLMEVKGIIALAAAIAYIGFGIIAFRRNRMVFFGLMLIAVPLLPVLYIPGLGESPLAERYLYLPSVGFAFLEAMFFVWLREKMPGYGAAVIAGAIVLTVSYSVETIMRNPVWKDNLTLFADTVQKSPAGELPRGMLGIALLESGRVDEAVEQFQMIISKIDPNSENAYYNLGRALRKKGMTGEAAKAYEKAVSLKPDDIDAHYNVAVIYAESRQMDKALEHFRVVVQLQPNSAFYRNVLGIAYGEKGLYDEAIEQFKIAVQLAPTEPAYRRNLERASGLRNSASNSLD